MSETLTFGPQWLRALSSGNSVTSPPPSPGPKYKMAEYRYGKEEMLALFIEDLVKPVELDHFSSISKTKSHFPLAFIPPTEEEQRYSLGSVNSNAVLKLMGRGAPRGAARGVRGGLGGRGRGRGDGGYMRQSSYEDSRPETGGFRDPRRQGWEESRRGGFDRGNASGRGYDPTLRGRLSSDTTWDKNDKGHENWRSGVQHDTEDDGGGWRVSGQRSFDKSDRWRGGSKISRSTSWRNSDSFRDERNFGEEEWQIARGPRARSFHERDDRPWNHPSEPEWCKDDDFEDLDVTGTFDSSGAFRSQKKEETRSDASVKELNNQEAKLQTDDKDENVHEQKEPNDDENRSNDEKPQIKQQIEEKTPTTASGGLTQSGRTVSEQTTSTTQENVQVTSVATTSEPVAVSTSPTHKTDEKAPQLRPSATKSEEREVNDESESDKKEDEPNMEHFAKAAENLVMSLDDEVEKSDPDSQPPGFHVSPVTAPTSQLEEIKWFYTDPQGKMQGPFTNTEMADWFNHGYFTMSLMIKRSIDEAFQPLGELIKSWGRVPFLPGPQPPPLKGMPDQIQQQQHLLAQQQQYQQLLQQHMIQQRFLQQQAIIMQQQLQMHRQQEQQAPTTTTSPHSTSSHNEIPPPHLLQTTLEHQQHLQALQQQQLQQHQLQQQLQQQQQQQQQHHQHQQQQQQQRPQALSVSSESIWGGSGTTSTSPGMSPGPWSPVSTANPASTVSAAVRGWDVEHGNKERIQSLQEIQRIEEEKERAIKLEKERREAALRQEEELRKRQQQEFLMQRQREEEERRRQEETEKKKREQEEILKKQQEEELRKQQQLAERQKQIEEQKKQMEEQKMIEMRKQQQQALVRLQQQQQELQHRKEIELQKQKELQLKLQQKRQQSQNGSSTLWGPAPASAAPSLTEIQQQQEKRERNAQQEKERLLQHEREQQQKNAAATAGWTERNSKGPSNVKSLVEIQQEQERQLAKKQNQQLTRSHPQQQSSHNLFSSPVWGNNSSVLSSWAAPTSTAPSTNAWGGASKMGKQTSQFVGDDDDDNDDDDDDDDDDDEEESFWDEAVKEAKKAGQSKQQPKQQQQQKKHQQQQQPKGQSVQHKNKQPSNAAFPGLGNKCQAKRSNKDEENVRRIFQQQASASDEFARWFEKSLRNMKVTSIDIPTFFAFLKDVESPYEVHDYVKSYVGDSKEAHEFARDFIEQRKQAPSRKTQNTQPLPEDSVWGNGNPKPLPSKTCGNQQQQQQQPQEDYVQNAQADSTTNKRKKKKKMQKVDPRILGFSVNAAERVNIGEIQTLEDA